jgi:hypothetical protein
VKICLPGRIRKKEAYRGYMLYGDKYQNNFPHRLN